MHLKWTNNMKHLAKRATLRSHAKALSMKTKKLLPGAA